MVKNTCVLTMIAFKKIKLQMSKHKGKRGNIP